jgi:AraC-like DNA-binding protein
MSFTFDERRSDSPFVELVCGTQSQGGGSFISTAGIQWEMVVTKQSDKISFTVRGPETKATPSHIPEDAEFFGIRFKLGTFMPHLPNSDLVDNPVNLPEVTSKSFWLQGASWELPTFDNADTFVARLVHEGLLVREPVVEAAVRGQLTDLSLRSIQRRFLRATGLTYGTLFQIERARQAMAFLEKGVSILDTIDLAGYFDQPHLTRSLKRFMGQTPAQIVRNRGFE